MNAALAGFIARGCTLASGAPTGWQVQAVKRAEARASGHNLFWR